MKHKIEYDGRYYHVTAHFRANGLSCKGLATVYAKAQTRDEAIRKADSQIGELIRCITATGLRDALREAQS